jgi:hypothetical protein
MRWTSSDYESLVSQNKRFNTAGKSPMTVTFVPGALKDEVMLEMLNVGRFEAIEVSGWNARMWAQILPQIRVYAGGKMG